MGDPWLAPFTSPPTSLSCCLGLVVEVRVFWLFVHGSGSFDDVKVHLAMAPDAVVLNLHTDALEVICNSEYQCRRPTTGITVASSCRTYTAYPHSISVMEAALHCMATSIAQLTLCQVASEEIETANATRQLRNWVASWTAAQSQPATKCRNFRRWVDQGRSRLASGRSRTINTSIWAPSSRLMVIVRQRGQTVQQLDVSCGGTVGSSCGWARYWRILMTRSKSPFFGLFLCLMGLLTGLCIGPLPALLRLSTDRRPCMIIYNSSFCCGWTCVTTWRKPWRRWTEKKDWPGPNHSP